MYTFLSCQLGQSEYQKVTWKPKADLQILAHLSADNTDIVFERAGYYFVYVSASYRHNNIEEDCIATVKVMLNDTRGNDEVLAMDTRMCTSQRHQNVHSMITQFMHFFTSGQSIYVSFDENDAFDYEHSMIGIFLVS